MPQNTEHKTYRWERFKEWLFGHQLTYEEMQNLKKSPGFDPHKQLVHETQFRAGNSRFPVGL